MNSVSLAAVAIALAIFSGIAGPAPAAETTEQSLATVLAVGMDGKGHVDAQRAMRELCAAPAKDLPAFLSALDRAAPLPANWIRNAFESVADREIHGHRLLPLAEFERFVRDPSHSPRARRLAYEWLAKVDRSAPGRLIPGMLLDPSAEFRRDAVALRIAEAGKLKPNSDKQAMIRLYREALAGAVHDDQVKTIVHALDGLGQKVNVAEHFAFIRRFSVIGPFDNRGRKGLEAVYPPEKEIRLDAQYDGKLGKVSWQPLETSSEYGVVDLAKQVKPYKEAAMYTLAEFQSPEERSVELRLSTQNAWKIWINSDFLFAREEYHRGSSFDQYRVPARLRAGRNTILLKICQNEQTEDWAQSYQFQLRVCDASGRGIRSQSVSVSRSRH